MKKTKTRFFDLFFRKKERLTEKISIFAYQKNKLCGLTVKTKANNNQNTGMGKIITMGEIMLRLSTPGQSRFVQTDTFDINYGGGEANVAVSCAHYGHEAYFVSKLPKHEIGQAAVNALRRYGVHTDFIARGGQRVGIYYLETGASMRPSKVIYDRAGSSIAETCPDDFDFDAIMEGADWFHWSGITPAISDASAECLRQACIAAKKHGVTVSCDLNFRKKLWTSEKAQSIMKPLMQ